LANARAADGLVIKRDCAESMDLEMQFAAKFFQQRNITAALVAKGKICAHADTVNSSKIAGQRPNEVLTTLLAELFVEADQQNVLDAQRLNSSQFLRQRIDQ